MSPWAAKLRASPLVLCRVSAGDGQVGMIDARDVAATAAAIATAPKEHADSTG